MAVTTFTLPYFGTPPYYSGTAVSALVPAVFPVAIDGRPFMVDQKSGKFQRGYEQRVRQSQDTSTTPGEAAINPGGLWRRGQDSWHAGAGQAYADSAESGEYRFYKSKGINPWVKGQLSLHNATLLSNASASTNLFMTVVGSELYWADNQAIKYTSNPFTTTPTIGSATLVPASTVRGVTTDGSLVYATFPGTTTAYGLWQVLPSTHVASLVSSGHEYGVCGYAKGRLFVAGAGANSASFWQNPTGVAPAATFTHSNTSWNWVGFTGGQNAIYAAGYAGKTSLIYKITITAAGVIDTPVVALQLPTGEVVTAISAYLGFVLLGTNKGVRYCSTDSNSNLVAGQLIPTSGAVKNFASNGRFSYFTWTNYDGVSTGLGALDLSVFIAPNTPAFATDLMYGTDIVKVTADVTNVVIFDDPVTPYATKKVFTVSGVGVIAEDADNLVASGEIESGTWRWGIPDRKFIAKIDTRSTPLVGSIASYFKIDDGAYESAGTWSVTNDTENSFNGSNSKAIEVDFKFVLERATATTGPTFTRWMARAYAAPFRSQVFSIPILLHKSLTVRGKEYYYDVDEQQEFFDDLIAAPRIVTLQIGSFTYNVIAEDVVWEPVDSAGNSWAFDGTLVVTLRSVEN